MFYFISNLSSLNLWVKLTPPPPLKKCCICPIALQMLHRICMHVPSREAGRLGEPYNVKVACWRARGQERFPEGGGQERWGLQLAKPEIRGLKCVEWLCQWPHSAKRPAGTCFLWKMPWRGVYLSGFLLRCVTEAQFRHTKQKWECAHITRMSKGGDSAADRMIKGSTDVIKNPSLYLCVLPLCWLHSLTGSFKC